MLLFIPTPSGGGLPSNAFRIRHNLFVGGCGAPIIQTLILQHPTYLCLANSLVATLVFSLVLKYSKRFLPFSRPLPVPFSPPKIIFTFRSLCKCHFLKELVFDHVVTVACPSSHPTSYPTFYHSVIAPWNHIVYSFICFLPPLLRHTLYKGRSLPFFPNVYLALRTVPGAKQECHR